MRQNKAEKRAARQCLRRDMRRAKAISLLLVTAYGGAVVATQFNKLVSVDVSLSEGVSADLALADVRLRTVSLGGHDDAPGVDAFADLRDMYRNQHAQIADYFDAVANYAATDCAFGFIDYCPKPVREALISAYRAYVPSVAYEVWSTQRRDAFLAQVEHDAYYVEARANWPHMDRAARAALIERISGQYVAAFSEEGFEIPAPYTGVIDAGMFGFRGVQVPIGVGPFQFNSLLLLDEALVMERSFDDTVGVAMHEAQHVVQMNLAAKTYWPDGIAYLQAHGIYHDARIFERTRLSLLTEYYGREIDGVLRWGQAYYLNPIEQDARVPQAYSHRVGAGQVIFADMGDVCVFDFEAAQQAAKPARPACAL